MFGVSHKKFKIVINEFVDIIALHHENVNSLQEALGHLGEAVQSLNELSHVQEARIELLEKRLESKNEEE